MLIEMLPEALFGAFVSEVVSSCTGITKEKIKEAVKNRKNKHQNIESQIYIIIVDVLNEFTFGKYKDKDQDILFNSTEKILKGFQDKNIDKLDAVRNGLHNVVDDNKCDEFIGLLYEVFSKNEYQELYRYIRLRQEERDSKREARIEKKVDRNYNQQEFQFDRLNKKLEQGFNGISEKLDVKENKEYVKKDKLKKIKSRTQEYMNKWNDNMFLNNFDKRDENAGVNVKLREVYLDENLPHYFWKMNDEPSYDMKNLLSEYVDEKKENKMLLILGQPGIGKSTLITWIVANFTNSLIRVLVYNFASDLRNIDWDNLDDDIEKSVLGELNLSSQNLEGKTLILDGFDEISLGKDRADILNQLYWRLIKESRLHKFSLIITCRENYIQNLNRIKCDYITLKIWDKSQIVGFCQIYCDKNRCSISQNTITNIISNMQVFGVPFILYMTLALNILVKEEESLVNVYDKIFSLEEGGIYDRCINNYSYGSSHRISQIKEQIHLFSEKIAFWIFENNSSREYILKKDYTKICSDIAHNEMQEYENFKQDFLIGNYFRLAKYCGGEGTEELYFMHRTIYEYFTSEYIFMSLFEAINTSKEEFAGVLGKLFKGNILSFEMQKYLKYKIRNSKLNKEFNKIYESFQLMLENGMTFYTRECFKNVIQCEKNIFTNMLEILHWWDEECFKFNNSICVYLDCINGLMCYNTVGNTSQVNTLNLKRVDLTELYLKRTRLRAISVDNLGLRSIDLKELDLQDADLKFLDFGGLDLRRVDLQRTDLRWANFEFADLRFSDLRRADLNYAKFKGAKLKGANFSQSHFGGAELNDADLEGSIWHKDDIIKLLSQLKKASFTYIIIEEEYEQERVCKKDLFPNEK